jgi:hypothetical protein
VPDVREERVDEIAARLPVAALGGRDKLPLACGGEPRAGRTTGSRKRVQASDGGTATLADKGRSGGSDGSANAPPTGRSGRTSSHRHPAFAARIGERMLAHREE